MSSRSSSNYPQFDRFHHVGFVQSAHGIRGEVFVKLFAGAADWRAEGGGLSLLTPGARELATFGIGASRPHKDGLLIVFAGVRDRNAAEALKGAQVYVPDSWLVAAPGETIFLKQVLGFTVVDTRARALGEVVDFATNGAQDLLVIRRASDGRRALVPFVDAFLVDIDLAARVLKMDLPEGLLELADPS